MHALMLAAALQCGTERWSVKTLSDPAARVVNMTPQATTVERLRSLKVPANYDGDAPVRYPAELHVYRVKVLFIGWKQENDEDFHIVIADPKHPGDTMIAESPEPTCAATNDLAIQQPLMKVHNAFLKCFGAPGRYRKFEKPIPGEVTGVGFFDKPHGQTGVAPNAFELHPLLHFSTAFCP